MSDNILNLKVKEVNKETADAISIVFENPESGKLPYISGQFLTLICDINGEEVRRAYSLNSSFYTDENPAVAVKRVEGGKMSNYLNSELKPGTVMKVMEPMGNFKLEPSKENQRHVVLIAGGSGITPMMSILKTVLSEEPASVVSLIYVNKNKASIIFAHKLEELHEKHKGKFRLTHYLDDENSKEVKGGIFGLGKKKKDLGFINVERLDNILNSLNIEKEDKTEYYMCGPQGMMDVVEKTLTKRKVPKSAIKKESFVAQDFEVEGADGPAQVHVNFAGEEMDFEVKENQFILDGAMLAGYELPFSCQSGMCTACMGRCTEGEVKLPDGNDTLTPEQIAEGYVLTCVGKPVSKKVVIEIE